MASYLIKVFLTSLLLMPIATIVALSIFPGYHIPDMIGLIMFTYILPQTLLLCLVNTFSNGILIGTLRSKFTIRSIRLLISSSTLIVTFCRFWILYRTTSTVTFNDTYFLAFTFSLSMITCLWFYKLEVR